MKVTNELFAHAIHRLYKTGKAKDQKELASMTGITETTISRILNDRVKRPSEETIRKLTEVFPDAFDFEKEKNVSQHSDLIIEAKNETIASLKEQIANLKAHIADLQNTISLLNSSDFNYHFPVGTDSSKKGEERKI